MFAEWHVYGAWQVFYVSFSEFLEVGKKQPALDVLYDVIKSKKHRTWQKIHEPIMLKYLELCVDLRKSHLAKEGLYQYKNICQQVCIHVVFPYVVLTSYLKESLDQYSLETTVSCCSGEYQISRRCGPCLPETRRRENWDGQRGVSADGAGHWRSGQHSDPREVLDPKSLNIEDVGSWQINHTRVW